MKIQLFKNLSETNKLNKNIIFINEVSGFLRGETSLINPIFEIELDNYRDLQVLTDVVAEDEDISYFEDSEEYEVDAYTENISIFDINYIYVDEFERYYFIDNINVINNRLFRLICNEDSLSSKKEELLDLEMLVSRNEFTFDNTIEDELEPYEYGVDVSEDYIDTSDADIEFEPSLSDFYDNYQTYVISYLTNGGLPYDERVIQSPIEVLPNVSDTTKGFNNCNRISVMSLSYVQTLARYIIDHEDIASYIMSLIAYPFIVSSYFSLTPLVLGKTTIPNVNTYGIRSAVSPYFKVGSFHIDYDDFHSIEPYTKYELYLPYYDYVELKSSDILNSDINIYYSIDYENGSAKINIVNMDKNYVIKSVNCQIGVRIPLNRTNNQQLSDERTQLAIKSSIGILGSLASMVGGVASSNPFLIANSVGALSSNIIDTSVQLSQMHERASVSNVNGSDGLFGCQKPRLKVTKYISKEPNNYNHYYGKPLNQSVKLSELEGYTKVKEVHLENITATEVEKSRIEMILKDGIII